LVSRLGGSSSPEAERGDQDEVRGGGRRLLAAAWWWLPALLAVGTVFVLPWWLPPSGGPVVSESWTLGFGNRWAVVGLLAAVALATGLRWWRSRHQPDAAPAVAWLVPHEAPVAGEPATHAGTADLAASPQAASGSQAERGIEQQVVAGSRAARERWWERPQRVALVVSLAYGLLVLAFHLLIDGADYAESGYFQRRLRAVLAGARLWTDLEFVYGPLLLAPQLLLATWGASPRLAYDLTFAAASLGGILLCGRLLAACRLAPGARAALWIAVAAAAFDLGTGVNYTLLRFLAPLAVVLAGLDWLRAAAAGAPWRFVLALGAVSTGSVGLGTAFSPEVGIAGGVAAFAAGAAVAWRRPLVVGVGLLASALVLAALSTQLPEPFLAGFRAFAAGAHQLPVWPAPHNLLLVAAVLLVLPALGAGVLGRGPQAERWRGAWAALAAWAVVLLPGALGRADATHALFYGLVPLVGALVYLASRGRRAFLLGLTAFVAVFVVGNQGMTLWLGRGQLLAEAWASFGPGIVDQPDRMASVRAWASRLGLPAERVERALARGVRPGLPEPLIDAVNQCFLVATPLGVDEHVEADLRHRRRFAAAYFLDDHNLVTPADLQRKLGDLGAADCALVPVAAGGGGFGVYGDDPAAVESFLRRRLLYPLAYRPLRPAFAPRREILRVLERDWSEVTRVGEWRLLRPRAGG
jgi:hypothetical protein